MPGEALRRPGLPEKNAAIPQAGGQPPIGRGGQRGHRLALGIPGRRRRRAGLGGPEGDPAILPGAGEAAIGQRDQRGQRALMPAQHPPRETLGRVPEDDRLIEAGARQPAIAEHRQGADRAAMPRQLLRPGGQDQGQEQQGQGAHAAVYRPPGP